MSKEMSFDALIDMLDFAEEEGVALAEEALNENAEDLLSKSQDYAPVLAGDLMGSGSVDPATRETESLKARVGYSKEYSLRMHEDIYNLGELSEQKQSASGKKIGRKYLQRALVENSEKYTENIMKKVKGAFK
jgi:hypothetical protein